MGTCVRRGRSRANGDARPLASLVPAELLAFDRHERANERKQGDWYPAQ